MALTQGARTIRQPATPPSPWDTITLEEAQEDKCIPMGTLQYNSHRVRRLVFSGIVPSRYYNFTFSGLKEVCLQNIDLFLAEDEAGFDSNLQMFVFLNRNVERIDFENMPTLPGHNFWKAVFTHWRKLHELIIWSESSVTPESVDMFWRACTLPHSISFYKRVVIPRSSVLATMRFPCIRNLSMRFGTVDSKSMGPADQLTFFKACTDLKSLSWKVHNYDLRELQLAKSLASSLWRKLEGLCFTGTTIPDDVLSDILQKGPELKSFMDGTGGFGPRAHAAMKERHFCEITFLSVSGCLAFTSPMVQEVLSGCYNLLFFRADHILVEDILTSFQAWICLALEYLCVSIVKKPDADTTQDERVCQRIEKLNSLRYLDLRPPHRRPFTATLPAEYKDRISLDLSVIMRFPRFATLKAEKALLV
ncbi:hypothetical protein BGZ67_007969 [Mortierella alpina]|nr:hypothetical protein BGZ67_007969 [Mortierella alpina]